MYRILIKRNDKVQPVLKWAGGKRQILNEISKYIPKNFNTYYEPFLGGGSVLFNIQPINAVVNDMNSELINMYQVVKDNVEELIQYLKAYRNNEEYFYKIRNLDRDKNIFNKLNHIERASRLIYLNRTCFNGLYRTNKSGEFNAPFGKYDNPTILNKDLLRAISKYFNIANIKFL
ncbi:MAG: Dam family site-specific DNA-(adenine-N6)-methyltransferase, partial [Chitinophagaceae bacterium]|nr:Dam family site-specific DNA-(adenine-N6)-methyltransferase [Chitinophagaceae bacterium]